MINKYLIICLILITSPELVLSAEKRSLNVEKLKTYVINLDRLINKYDPIKNQLTMYELPPTRFSAVDGYSLRIKDKMGHEFTGKNLVDNTAELLMDNEYNVMCPTLDITYPYDPEISNRPLTAGELGCYCSHIGIYSDIVAKKQEYSLVLEDDAILGERFLTHLNNVLTEPPKDWDVIYISGFLNKIQMLRI